MSLVNGMSLRSISLKYHTELKTSEKGKLFFEQIPTQIKLKIGENTFLIDISTLTDQECLAFYAKFSKRITRFNRTNQVKFVTTLMSQHSQQSPLPHLQAWKILSEIYCHQRAGRLIPAERNAVRTFIQQTIEHPHYLPNKLIRYFAENALGEFLLKVQTKHQLPDNKDFPLTDCTITLRVISHLFLKAYDAKKLLKPLFTLKIVDLKKEFKPKTLQYRLFGILDNSLYSAKEKASAKTKLKIDPDIYEEEKIKIYNDWNSALFDGWSDDQSSDPIPYFLKMIERYPLNSRTIEALRNDLDSNRSQLSSTRSFCYLCTISSAVNPSKMAHSFVLEQTLAGVNIYQAWLGWLTLHDHLKQSQTMDDKTLNHWLTSFDESLNPCKPEQERKIAFSHCFGVIEDPPHLYKIDVPSLTIFGAVFKYFCAPFDPYDFVRRAITYFPSKKSS